MRELFPRLPTDPRQTLLEADLPQGAPWAWLLAHLLWYSPLAPRLLREGLSPAVTVLLQQALVAMQQELSQLEQSYPLPSIGHRTPSPAELAALMVLQTADPQALLSLYQRFGFGIFASNTAFRFDGDLKEVSFPDNCHFEELVGYSRQLEALRRNAERFLEGKTALSTLLYGARGCGKSTAVKALRTAYHPRGLRLVEVLPQGLLHLPHLLEQLRPLPSRFVLYLDDLSLNAQDPHFHWLKALLEGAVFARPSNVWVVATSNRRNLVNESWSDRPDPGSEPHAWDALQDKLALADRFGLTLTFPPFDKTLYLQAIAQWLGRDLDAHLTQQALQFAAEGRGISGRTAHQFALWVS